MVQNIQGSPLSLFCLETFLVLEFQICNREDGFWVAISFVSYKIESSVYSWFEFEFVRPRALSCHGFPKVRLSLYGLWLYLAMGSLKFHLNL